MSKPKKTVFLVSAGKYSDYGVICVCADLETAKRAVAAYDNYEAVPDDLAEAVPDDLADVEEVEIYSRGFLPKKEAHYTQSAVFAATGDLDHVGEMEVIYRLNFLYPSPPVLPKVTYEPIFFGGAPRSRLRAWGADEADVARALADALAAHLARQPPGASVTISDLNYR